MSSGNLTAANRLAATRLANASPAQVKTGNRAAGTPAGQMILLGNSLAGYIQAKSGRQLTFMIAVGNVPISSLDDVLQVTDDQARMVAAIQQSL